MRRVFIIGVFVLLVLGLYLVFTVLFARVFLITSDTPPPDTPTPVPTFTATPTATPLVIVEAPTFTPTATTGPTLTPTPSEPSPTPTVVPTSTPTPAVAQLIAGGTVNIRAGPGTNYPVLGSLPPNTPLTIVAQNQGGDWWQVQIPDNRTGWVAASVVEAQNVADVPVTAAPPAPRAPTATPVPPEPVRPAYQFEPTGWYGDTNYGLTRFLGSITDVNGNPVNGVSVEAQCGGYRVISNPSGPVGGWKTNDGANDPPGFYDITLGRNPIPCNWILTVVYTEDGETVLQRLSEPVEVVVTTEESVITANWRKNW